jgi:TonB family protein
VSDAVWNNLLTYALQLGLLIGVAGWIPAALRLRSPKARLAFFQALLVACLLLPAIRPWKSETIAIAEPMTPVQPVPVSGKPAPQHTPIDPREVVFGVLAVGIAARLGMLTLGMFRLRRYRLQSVPLSGAEGWSREADIRVSAEVSGPVTFGLLRPVILLPAQFEDLSAGVREAILSHEAAHVRRRDWLFTLAEEIIRAGLWFHPAIWWLLGEIQLAREQAVDREALAMTNAQEPYVDALLSAAGAALEPDLAPAPLFLRRRHLKQRVFSILKEQHMSKTRTVSTLAASLAFLAGACWYLTGALPLSGQPQLAPDGPGVTVDLMGSQVMHRAPVRYSPDALTNKIEGMVVAQVTLDTNGNVIDAKALSGPDELRKPVLQSLLSWHFTKDAASSMRQVSVTFHLPETQAAPANGDAGGVAVGEPGALERQRAAVLPAAESALQQAGPAPAATMLSGSLTVSAPPLPRTTPPENRKLAGPRPMPEKAVVRSITVQGLRSMPEGQVISKLPLQVGGVWTPDSWKALLETARDIDEHLRGAVSFSENNSGADIRLFVASSESANPGAQTPLPPNTLVVGGLVQANKLVSQLAPIYPAIARQAHISGTIELAAIIGEDGHVQQLTVVSGHPLLRPAALDAVKQWVYQPTLMNGQPVNVSTTIDVIFSLEN